MNKRVTVEQVKLGRTVFFPGQVSAPPVFSWSVNPKYDQVDLKDLCPVSSSLTRGMASPFRFLCPETSLFDRVADPGNGGLEDQTR